MVGEHSHDGDGRERNERHAPMGTPVNPAPFGAILKRHRLAAGLTHDGLAERAGLSARAISDLERGVNRAPRRATLTSLADALRLPPTDRAELEAAGRRPRQAVRSGATATTLPSQLTHFIGRVRELIEVDRLLRTARLVNLTGAGGCGKSRLALQVADTLIAEFPDGVYLVPLETLVDPSQVLPAIADQVGMAEPAGTRSLPRTTLVLAARTAEVADQRLLERLLEHLREKRLLLVLDNFEQVLGAAPLVADMLVQCRHLKLLVTSRTPLHVRGEQEFPVPPLGLPDPTTPLPPAQRLATYDAIALFVQRARAAKPEFTLTDDNASAVAEICQRLDGLPLAIELAAARIKLLPPQAINAQLHGRRLALLTGGGNDVPIRQQTLRGAIGWSYDLLSSDEQATFERLAIFAGGCTLGAAQALFADHTRVGLENHETAAPDVLERLAGLVDKSLVQPAGSASGEPRFVMLETIREFALERLEATGDAATLRRQHLTYFVALAEEAEPKLFGAEQVVWFDRLAREHDNIRAALRWAVEGREVELGLRLGGALWWFSLLNPYLGEQRDRLATLLGIAEDWEQQPSGHLVSHRPTPLVRARALIAVGGLGWASGDLAAARTFLAEALTISQELGASWGICAALTALGHVARGEQDYSTAQRLYEQALSSAREAVDRPMMMFDLYNLGILRHIQGDDAGARPFLVESLAIGREVGDRWTVAASLANLGHVARSQGDFATARSRYDESLAVFRQVGDRTSIAYALAHLGMLSLDEHDPDAARLLLEESLALRRDVSNKRFLAGTLEGLAGVASVQGQATRALRLAGAAAALRAATGRPPTATEQARLERWLAPAWTELGDTAGSSVWQEGGTMALEEAIRDAVKTRAQPKQDSARRVRE